MKLSNYKLVFVILIAALLVPFTAHATDVDYDAVDEAALPMVAQTALPQAADQFCRSYRQLLIYDYEEYSNDYDYNNLEGSLVASSIVVWYGMSDADLPAWMGALCALASDGLGYEDGSAKLQTLSSTQSFLGDAWQRIKSAYSDFYGATVACMKSDAFAFGAAVLGIVAAATCFFATPGAGLAVAGFGAIGLATVCILVGAYNFYKTLFFGSLCVGFPIRYRKNRRQLRQ